MKKSCLPQFQGPCFSARFGRSRPLRSCPLAHSRAEVGSSRARAQPGKLFIVFPPLCPEGPIDINMSEIRMDDIHELFSRDPAIKLGGHWKPSDCVPRWKVGYESDPRCQKHIWDYWDSRAVTSKNLHSASHFREMGFPKDSPVAIEIGSTLLVYGDPFVPRQDYLQEKGSVDQLTYLWTVSLQSQCFLSGLPSSWRIDK